MRFAFCISTSYNAVQLFFPTDSLFQFCERAGKELKKQNKIRLEIELIYNVFCFSSTFHGFDLKSPGNSTDPCVFSFTHPRFSTEGAWIRLLGERPGRSEPSEHRGEWERPASPPPPPPFSPNFLYPLIVVRRPSFQYNLSPNFVSYLSTSWS